MKVNNISIGEHIRDRVKLYFKPLLCCTSYGKKELKCKSCPINVFTDDVVDTIMRDLSNIAVSNIRRGGARGLSNTSNLETLPFSRIALLKNIA